jgi:hypothetical protein
MEVTGRQVGRRPALHVGDHLFHHSATSVVLLGVDQRERGVGERAVVAVGGEQLPWARTWACGLSRHIFVSDPQVGGVLAGAAGFSGGS